MCVSVCVSVCVRVNSYDTSAEINTAAENAVSHRLTSFSEACGVCVCVCVCVCVYVYTCELV